MTKRKVAAAALFGAGFAAGLRWERHRLQAQAISTPDVEVLPTLDGLHKEQAICDDGVVLAVREGGAPAGERVTTVVFVHGYTVTSDCWAAQVRDLELSNPDLRLVLYDQRGHGASGVGQIENDTIEQLGHDLAAVLSQRVPEGPVVLVGHSMGGMTIMALAEQHPEVFGTRVVGAALIDTSSGGMRQLTLGLPAALAGLPGRLLPYAPRTVPIGRRAERLRPADSDLGRWVNSKVAFAPGAAEPAKTAMTRMQASVSLETLAAFLPTFATHERTGALAPLRAIPTLVMVGEQDVLTPPSHSEAIVNQLPAARLVVVPGSGHMVLLEAPEVVTEALRSLIEQVQGAILQ